jgi:hypothetical protein
MGKENVVHMHNGTMIEEKWMELEIIVLSEINETQKDKLFSLM